MEFIGNLKREVRESTSSMTSIPKPFKFIKPHYGTLVKFHENCNNTELENALAEFISVISMSMADPYDSHSLRYLLKLGRSVCDSGDFVSWGQEYLQQLSADLVSQYEKRLVEETRDNEDLMSITRLIVKNFTDHNMEMNAIDLLMEMDQIDLLKNYVSKDNYKKVYDYLVASSHFSADHDDFLKILEVAYGVAMQFDDFSNSLRVSIKLDDDQKIKDSFEKCVDPVYKKQLAFALGRQRIVLECENEELVEIFSNSLLSEFYIKLATELNVLAPKKPEEVLKTQIDDSSPSGKIDSAKLNLADTYVNAFVNVGTGQDSLMQREGKEPWIHSVKDAGIMAATASLGLIFLWDFHGCSSAISDYLDMKDGWAKAGALLGIGLSNSGVWSELDPAKAILEDNLESSEECVKKGAIVGLGLAYAGTAREEFLETITPHLNDTENSNVLGVNSALSLALIHVGKCNEEVVNSILTSMMCRSEAQLNESISKMYGIALGLCYLGRQSLCEPALETLKSIEHPVARFSEVILEACAYIGSGNVLKIQQFLQKCTTHEEPENSLPQAAAVMGIALLAISEEVGNEMAVRAMHHIMQYCELPVKRAIPIAMALLSISNPKLNIVEILSKFAHDEDAEISRRAIFALGLVAAGTNNSKVADLLRGLGLYYRNSSDHTHVFMVRIATGLLFAGKGIVTLNPFYSDKLLYSKVSMGGLIIVAAAMLDTENI